MAQLNGVWTTRYAVCGAEFRSPFSRTVRKRRASLGASALGAAGPFLTSSGPQRAPGHFAAFAKALLRQLHAVGRNGDHVSLAIHFDLALDCLVELRCHGNSVRVWVETSEALGV